jgi:hypothetical protein
MRWAWGKPALALAVAALFAARWLAEFTGDRLWADALGVAAPHTDIALLRLALGLGAFALATAWYVGNLLLLYRQIGAVQVPRQVGNLEIVEHVPRRYLLIGAIVTGAGLGFAHSLGAGEHWISRALSGAAIPIGLTDPVLGHDFGYYLFELPWLRALHGYALWLAGIALFLLALLYGAIGAIRREERRLVFLPFARWHLAALSGTFALALAWGYALEPAELAAGLHDVPYDRVLLDVRVPAALVLTVMAVGVAAASLVWMRVDRSRIPATAWAVLLGSSFLAHFVVPPAVASGRSPEERLDPELAAAAAEAWHGALGAVIDTIPVPLAVPDPRFPERHERELAGTPVWDAFVLTEVLNRVARPAPPDPRAFGRFFAADLTLLANGSRRSVPTFLAVRESDSSATAGRPGPAVGAVAVHASRVAPGGLPLFLPDLSQPDSVVGRWADVPLADAGNWFTPGASGYALVPSDGGPLGIPLGSFGRRLALAWGLQAPSLLSSRRAPTGSLVVAERAVAARLARYAPFARFGAAWPAVLGGRVVWLAWGYVAAEAYPLGSPVAWRGERVRYLQAGLLGTVDAGTGVVRVYLAHDADPVSRAWQRTLPDLVLPFSAMPPGLRAYQRYPDELFTAQLQLLRTATGRARPSEPYWWAGTSVGDSTLRLRLRAVDEVQLEPRVAAVLEGVVVDGALRLRVLRYAPPFDLTGPSELERSFAAAAPPDAAVGGRLRILPFEDGAVAVQTFYADSGTITGMVAGWRGAIGVGGTMREALRGIGPTPRAVSGAPVPVVSLEAAREWFGRLDRARASGDWEAWGEAWAGLRAALGLGGTPPPRQVDPPTARD